MRSLDAMAKPRAPLSKDMLLKALGAVLDQYRERLGLQKDELSKRVGKSAPYYGQIVKAKIRPSYAALVALMDELRVPAADRWVARIYLAAAQVEDPDLAHRVYDLLPPRRQRVDLSHAEGLVEGRLDLAAEAGPAYKTQPGPRRAARSNRRAGGAKQAG